jgi:hypothetical protein
MWTPAGIRGRGRPPFGLAEDGRPEPLSSRPPHPSPRVQRENAPVREHAGLSTARQNPGPAALLRGLPLPADGFRVALPDDVLGLVGLEVELIALLEVPLAVGHARHVD